MRIMVSSVGRCIGQRGVQSESAGMNTGNANRVANDDISAAIDHTNHSTWCYTRPVKRVLKTKAFARWCVLSDTSLCMVAREIERGEYEADLGKGVVKKRVAYPGRGKRSGARLLVAQRMKGFIIFLVGRDKSDPGTDFSSAQEDAAKELAIAYEKLTPTALRQVIDTGILKEICNDPQSDARP
jgi:hypothetical protein